MNTCLYRGTIEKIDIVQSNRLRTAITAEVGVQGVPLQIRVKLTHFKDLTESPLKSEWLPCLETDKGALYEDMIAEFIAVLDPSGKTYSKGLVGPSLLFLNYEPSSDDVFVELTFLCPDLELGAKYRKDGEQLRTCAPHFKDSRRLWRLENCIVTDINLLCAPTVFSSTPSPVEELHMVSR